MIVWPRLLRYLTRDRHVPADRDTKARIGTWAWLNGRDMRRKPVDEEDD
jgi:hypothetical protein